LSNNSRTKLSHDQNVNDLKEVEKRASQTNLEK